MTEEIIKLDKNSYLRLKSMLESSDVENVIIGIEILENIDFKKNLVYVLMLVKEVPGIRISISLPKTITFLNSIYEIPDKYKLSFTQIINVLKIYKASKSDYEFLLDRYMVSKTREPDDHIISRLKGIINKIKEDESTTKK